MSIIETHNLTKMYGSARGITDINLTIEEGEVFGFIGPNGAGKSTTIRTLLGLIFPTSGSATIFGKDILKDGPEIREQIGYLPSEVFYYDGMRVKDLLEYSASFYKKDCSARIEELAETLDLDLNKKIDDLSYGNKKKVGIVQGLLHEPKLVILDEPTGGLDPLMQERFFELLKKENEKGATIFFSSHILSEVQKMCDRVAIIKEGKIITVEKIATLLDNNYKKIKVYTTDDIQNALTNIEGIKDIDHKENQYSFLFKGDINIMVELLHSITITNIWIEEPSLEEIFMHYYQKEEKE
jgi:ABC-2 type transport system ATP-binding protein